MKYRISGKIAIRYTPSLEESSTVEERWGKSNIKVRKRTKYKRQSVKNGMHLTKLKNNR